MPVDPLPPSIPCPPPHLHRVHRIVGRFRHRGIVHHLAHTHSATTGCAKLPPGAPGALPAALLPKLVPAALALAAGAALVTAAARFAAPAPTIPLPAWPPNAPSLPTPSSPGIPNRPPIPIGEPSSTPLFAAAALVVALSQLGRGRALYQRP